MHDAAAAEGRPLSDHGVRAQPSGTLVDRAVRFLGEQVADSLVIARDVLGISRATRAVADRVAVALLGSDPRIQRLPDGRWALAATREGATALADCTFAVVDVETTGMRARHGDRVTEIAVATLNGDRVDLPFETLVNPERPIPAFITSLTRITDDMVRDMPTFPAISPQVVELLAGRVFAAHNVRFDWSFVSAEVRRAQDLALEGPRVCTVVLARRLVPGLRSRTLDSLAAYFGVEIGDRHRAAGDALATAEILRRLLGLAQEQGVATLEELHALGRSRRRKKTALPTSVPEL